MTEDPRTPVRLYMVEDHPIVRRGLRLLLEQYGMQICGEAADPETAMREILLCSPDLVMVDLSLGDQSGLHLLQGLASLAPNVPLLVHSIHEDSYHIAQAFSAGASGYVTKREAASVLEPAIRSLLEGKRYASPRVARVLETLPLQETKRDAEG